MPLVPRNQYRLNPSQTVGTYTAAGWSLHRVPTDRRPRHLQEFANGFVFLAIRSKGLGGFVLALFQKANSNLKDLVALFWV